MLRRGKPPFFGVALPLLLATVAPLSARSDAPSFDMKRVGGDIAELSADAFEGRGTASPAEARTVDWLVRKMQAAGLSPGGEKRGRARTWTQAVPLLETEIVGIPHLVITQGISSRKLLQGQDIAVRAPLTGATNVAVKGAPLLFVGYGVSAPERQWDDFKGVPVAGKILVVLVNDPDFEGGEGDFGGRAMTYYGRWTYKYEEAARRGAAGVLIVHEAGPAAYGWATVRSSNILSNFDIVRPRPEAAHTPIEAWIQRDVAVEMFQNAGLDFESLRAAARRRDFRPVPLPITLDADMTVKVGRIVTHNVVGKLGGRKHPDETVLFSAHWDHLGIGPGDARGDRIYNGARDNASGIAAMLELARAYAHAPRPDRTLLFVAFGAEEKGLLGSTYYAAHPLYPPGLTAGVINMDNIVGGGAARDFSIAGQTRLELLDLLIAEGAARGRRYTPDARPEAGSFYRSDHFPLARIGIPAISFSPGRDLIDGGVERGRTLSEAYVRDRYHQPGDEWDGSWDLGGLAADLPLLYATGKALADGRRWPNWSADAEFRAARDTSDGLRR